MKFYEEVRSEIKAIKRLIWDADVWAQRENYFEVQALYNRIAEILPSEETVEERKVISAAIVDGDWNE